MFCSRVERQKLGWLLKLMQGDSPADVQTPVPVIETTPSDEYLDETHSSTENVQLNQSIHITSL